MGITAIVLTLVSVADASVMPMPYPLPANFTFGQCGADSSGMTGCVTARALAPTVSVVCSKKPTCTAACAGSTLFQGTFSRYASRLGGTNAGQSAAAQTQKGTLGTVHRGHIDTKPHESATSYWWILNNTNCNLHDMPMTCTNLTIDQCKIKCEQNAECGGFLYYSKTGVMALKNSTCWADVGPLPPSDFGDDLFVMRNMPQPEPLPPTSAPITTVEVCVTESSESLDSSTDESYTVSIPADGTATVSAATIFGAMHGLETLTQLVDVRVGTGGLRTIPSCPLDISDAPRFEYRGLLIDSGRHFLPIDHVKHVVEAAAMVKLNVIHWHLVDSTSFATCSDEFPSLCAAGAYPNTYSPPTRNVSKAVYTKADMVDLVGFAKSRGVRIVPEWDMPGHGGWGYGMPELMTTACADAFDVTRPDLYDFLTKFLTEMGSIFTDDLLFLGGDELSVDCFDNTPTIAACMKEHGLNASSTQQYFWQEMTAKVFPKLNKTISVWRADDPNRGPYQTNVPRSTVFNVYQSLSTLWTQTIPAGTPSVVSIAGQNWYLDSECGGYNQNAWTCIYNLHGPSGSWLGNPAWTPEQAALFKGGETAIWGEGINEDNFDAFVWRGATAGAERLWSTEQSLGCPTSICPGITNVRPGVSHWLKDEPARLSDQLCRMGLRGIHTGPIGPGFCPSDAGSRGVSELHRLELENAMLRVKLARALK